MRNVDEEEKEKKRFRCLGPQTPGQTLRDLPVPAEGVAVGTQWVVTVDPEKSEKEGILCTVSYVS